MIFFLQILNIKLRIMANDLDEEQLKLIAERTHGFSGSDLENLCRKGKIESIIFHDWHPDTFGKVL
jgi:SpoVK/Ycf46/Vps4 family AAA+-type ATPase